MKVFVDTFDQVQRNYVKDVDRRELLQAAIEGMMTKLDPYSSYISPEKWPASARRSTRNSAESASRFIRTGPAIRWS